MKLKLLIASFISICLAVFVLDACKKKDVGGSNPNFNPTYLKFTIPEGFPQPPTDIFAGNPLTEEGFQLGRKLFYDGRLSKDGNFPCASCHQQPAGFATYDHQFSHGFNNTFTTRNAPALFNLAWMKEMQWDGGVTHIELQPFAPITAANEMDETIENVLSKLKADTAYPRMFASAFADGTINTDHLMKALSQYMGSIQSFNSKYDQVKRGEASFSISEQSGYETYKSKCATCHPEPLFTDNSFRNTGFALDPILKDIGRMKVTTNPADSLKFKVPSLRNIDLSFPYMHDGRMYSLSQVIDHYRLNIVTTQPTLDPLLKNKLAITDQEKVDLVQFLYTLTDYTMVGNSRYAQP